MPERVWYANLLTAERAKVATRMKDMGESAVMTLATYGPGPQTHLAKFTEAAGRRVTRAIWMAAITLRHLLLLLSLSSCPSSSSAYSAHPSRYVPSTTDPGCPDDPYQCPRSLRVMSTYNLSEWVRSLHRSIPTFLAHLPAPRGIRSRLVPFFLTRCPSPLSHARLVLQRTN